MRLSLNSRININMYSLNIPYSPSFFNLYVLIGENPKVRWHGGPKMVKNKDENVHRFALSAIRGELLEREREREKEERGKRERKKREK